MEGGAQTDKNIILNEVRKNLPNMDGVAYSSEDDHIIVNIKGKEMFQIDADVIAYVGTSKDEPYPDEFQEILSSYKKVKNYLSLIEEAEGIKVADFDGRCKKLLEFNDIVLVGIEKKSSVEFVTWIKNNRGYTLGHYFGNNFEGAKEDFVKRSELVDSNKLFTNEELIEISRCIDDTLGGGFELTSKQEDILNDIKNSIKNAIPDYEDVLNNLIQKEMEQTM